MKKSEFINRVILTMNEAGTAEVQNIFTVGADSTQVDRYIEGSFVDAWRRCAGALPRSWFKNQSFKDYPIIPDLVNGIGSVVMPSDFYLLTSFKMKGWQKPVFESFIENDRTSSIQSNEYARGSSIRPAITLSNKVVKQTDLYNKVAAIDVKVLQSSVPTINQLYKDGETYYLGTSEGLEELSISLNGITQVVNYYSLQKGLTSHEIEEAIYVPTAKALSEYGDSDEIDIDQRILEPLVYLSASTVFTLFEKYNISKALEERVAQMIPGFKSIKGDITTMKQ